MVKTKTIKKASTVSAQANDLSKEIAWFRSVFDLRLNTYFQDDPTLGDIRNLEPPNLNKSKSVWALFVKEFELNWEERLAVLLAFMPHLQPQALDLFFTKNTLYDRPFTEFGGIKSNEHKGFLPSGETLLFLLSGADMNKRLEMISFFHPDHKLIRNGILQLHHIHKNEPPACGALLLDSEFISTQTHGLPIRPVFSQGFPAKRIETSLEWSDLILNQHTLEQIEDIKAWIDHGDTLLHDWKMLGRIRPGLRVLFYGPPGTGKTMTACLLGKSTGREVYRIDLSMVVSKYIGETEKNLNNIFQKAESKDWILFFDEADALFGKRTETKSAHDRYANQEVSFLLQRIEQFDGVVILATNFKSNLDKAFVRRFESYVPFSMPRATERFSLWKRGFSKKAKLNGDLDLEQIANKYELSGGAIMNVIRYTSLKALQRHNGKITKELIEIGVRREMIKEGRVI